MVIVGSGLIIIIGLVIFICGLAVCKIGFSGFQDRDFMFVLLFFLGVCVCGIGVLIALIPFFEVVTI